MAEAIRGAVALLNASQDAAQGRRAAIAGELATIATRERPLLDPLGDGDAALSVSIKGRLRAELARRDALAAELEAIDTATPVDAAALVRGWRGGRRICAACYTAIRLKRAKCSGSCWRVSNSGVFRTMMLAAEATT